MARNNAGIRGTACCCTHTCTSGSLLGELYSRQGRTLQHPPGGGTAPVPGCPPASAARLTTTAPAPPAGRCERNGAAARLSKHALGGPAHRRGHRHVVLISPPCTHLVPAHYQLELIQPLARLERLCLHGRPALRQVGALLAQPRAVCAQSPRLALRQLAQVCLAPSTSRRRAARRPCVCWISSRTLPRWSATTRLCSLFSSKAICARSSSASRAWRGCGAEGLQ